MPLDATCPKCSHPFPVTEARHAFTVACPRCEAELTAEFKKPATPPEAGQAPYELLVRPGALPGTTAPPPPPRKKKDEDEDEPKRKGGSAMVVLLSGGLGLLFVLGGLGITGWYLFTQVDVETASSSRSGSGSSSNGPKGVISNPKGNTGPKGNTVIPGPSDPFTPTPPRPKRETFDLRPVGGTVPPISPPANLDPTFAETVLLPGKADAVAVGGGGRYLVFHIARPGRLVLFDANTGGFGPDTASTEDGDVMMAAGANKLVTTVPGSRKLRVYSLPDFQRQNEFDVPLFHGARGIAMGSRTNGPLLVVDPFGEVALMDLAAGRPIDGSNQKIGIPQNQIRAAADGKMFLAGNGYGNNDKFVIVDEAQKRWQVKTPDVAAGYPSADGKLLYGKDQILTHQGGTVAGKPAGLAHVWYVPAVTATGNYFLRVNEVKVGTPPRTKDGVSIAVHKDRRVDTPVLTAWEGLPEAEGLVRGWGESEPLDRHLFLIPEAKLLVILNRDKTKLVVRKLAI
ncbi:MAG: hypothetical protein J0I06_06655 [Planctomycetes bacterium]|nr:hypothetical protein [Planctomycetota bacterium]